MDNNDEIKITEFDSSVAVLYRLDKIIKTLHNLRGDIYASNRYAEELYSFWIEVNNKMNKEEKEKCGVFFEKIEEIQECYGSAYLHPFIKHPYSTEPYPNIAYHNCWGQLKPIYMKLEVFLMETADRHNMLMKDSKNAIDKFRTG